MGYRACSSRGSRARISLAASGSNRPAGQNAPRIRASRRATEEGMHEEIMSMSKTQKPSRRAVFAGEVARPIKRVSGRTPIDGTPLAVRTTGLDIDADVRDYARARLGIRLGKFATEIQRVSVRLEDVNGPRGGVDTACRIKVVLNGRDSVIAQEVAVGIREAIDRASHVVERAVGRAIRRSRPTAVRQGLAERPDHALA
ncbi:HPF/RaiA family ribosome-associated protein [Sorangium sp. So ce233]|uniref:HPF/RaiA family ribosome-associated protein n=1 Tax=Sorangium sp. So ce233 TaxID=3133290 RepID=UPI003F5D75ED